MKLTMKTVLSLLLFWGLSLTLQAQYTDAITTAVDKYNKAYMSKDYDAYLDHMIPSVIEVGGGTELMKNVTIEQVEAFAQSKQKIKSIELDSVYNVYHSKDAMHAVFSQTVMIEIGSDTFKKTAFYLGETRDDGETWKFIDLELYDRASLDLFVPGLSTELIIPDPIPTLKVDE